MKANSKAISVRVEHRSRQQSGGQTRHDLRLGIIPNYVDQTRIAENSVIIRNKNTAALKQICENRRGKKQRRMKSNAAISTHGIITFGIEAQKEINAMSSQKQDQAIRAVAEALTDRLGADLTGLVVHRDETAIHAHWQSPAWTSVGKPLSKLITPTIARELQDIAARTIQKFAPSIERGNSKKDRRAAGASEADLIHKSVKELHESLPAELDELREKIRKNEQRAEKAWQKAEEAGRGAEAAAKRAATYEHRAETARIELERLQALIDHLKVEETEIDVRMAQKKTTRERLIAKLKALSMA